jgi:hypothetical protein
MEIYLCIRSAIPSSDTREPVDSEGFFIICKMIIPYDSFLAQKQLNQQEKKVAFCWRDSFSGRTEKISILFEEKRQNQTKVAFGRSATILIKFCQHL